MTRHLALAPLLVLAACSGGSGGAGTPTNALTPVEPGVESLPAWQANCVGRARAEFEVGNEAIRLQGPTIAVDRSRSADGVADRGAAAGSTSAARPRRTGESRASRRCRPTAVARERAAVTVPLAGGCHCGAVRYRIDGAPLRHSVCHCGDCRRAAGAPAVAWAIVRAGQVMIEGAVSTYASSQHGRRDFCPRCGTGLFYRNAEIFPGLIDIQSATLDDPDGLPPPSEQVQTAERLAWMARLDALPAFDRYPADG